MTKNEVMQRLIDALDKNDNYAQVIALQEIRTALAQPEPDARKLAKIHQAAWNAVHKDYKDDPKCCFALGFDAGCDAVAQRVEPPEMESGERFESFPASPNKEWVGLTEVEINILFKNSLNSVPAGVIWNISRTIEAKLKEKNT